MLEPDPERPTLQFGWSGGLAANLVSMPVPVDVVGVASVGVALKMSGNACHTVSRGREVKSTYAYRGLEAREPL
jgi:hypothetical protein